MATNEELTQFLKKIELHRSKTLSAANLLEVAFITAPNTGHIKDYELLFQEIKDASYLLYAAIEKKNLRDRFKLNQNNDRIITFLKKLETIYTNMLREIRLIISTGCDPGSLFESLKNSKLGVGATAASLGLLAGTAVYLAAAWLVEWYGYCAVVAAWAPPVAAVGVGVGLFILLSIFFGQLITEMRKFTE